MALAQRAAAALGIALTAAALCLLGAPAALAADAVTVPVGSQPLDVAINPTGTEAWVTNISSGSVSVIDLGSGAVAATIGGLINPYHLTFAAGGTVWVMGYGSTTVYVIDAATRTVTTTVDIGAGGAGLVASPDGATVYVSTIANEIRTFDAATTAPLATFPAIAAGISLAATPDGSRLLVASSTVPEVRVIDAATGVIVGTASMPNTVSSLAVSADGATAYASYFSGLGVSVVDIGTALLTADLGVSAVSLGLGLNPASDRLYFTNRGTAVVTAVDPSTGTVIASTPVGQGPRELAIAADGSRMVVVNQFGDSVTVISAPLLSGGSLSAGNLNSPYDATLADPSATGIVTYSATGLPAGLSMTGDGAITGAPTEAGDYAIVVSATGFLGTRSAIYTLSVQGAVEPGAPALAATGEEVAPLVVIAAGAVLLGCALAVRGRSRT